MDRANGFGARDGIAASGRGRKKLEEVGSVEDWNPVEEEEEKRL